MLVIIIVINFLRKLNLLNRKYIRNWYFVPNELIVGWLVESYWNGTVSYSYVVVVRFWANRYWEINSRNNESYDMNHRENFNFLRFGQWVVSAKRNVLIEHFSSPISLFSLFFSRFSFSVSFFPNFSSFWNTWKPISVRFNGKCDASKKIGQNKTA